MNGFARKYLALIAAVMLGFSGFVACGAQMYKVSLQDDTVYEVAGSDDPNSPEFGLHAPGGWRTIPIHFKVDRTLTAGQQKGLTRAMATWELAVGKKLFVFEGVHSGVSGDSFSDLYSSLDDHVNGHYLDLNWKKTGKADLVLATTIWDNDPEDHRKILTADIRFNSNHYMIGDSFEITSTDERSVVDMQTLALHELGHLLGLAHVNQFADAYSIMTPALYIGEGLANRRLSRGDIERAQKVYGCTGDACDIEKTLARINKFDQESRVAKLDPESAH